MFQAYLVSHGIVTSAISNAIEFFKNIKVLYKNQRVTSITIKELSQLTDRELNDMGICRGDIWAIAHSDPSFKRANAKENPNLKGWV